MSGFVSRGFRGRRRAEADSARVPPGQYLTDDFPVLSAGPTPHTPLERWSFELRGAVDETVSWTWDELAALPAETVTVDIHCVTKWSKLDTVWTGVSVDTLLEGVETSAEFVVAFSDGGYTTNLPLEDVTGGKAWVATGYDGEPLDPEHGGPARLLVPHLFELRGPVGGYFVWESSLGGPVLLVGGGSGVVPLRAILRHHVGVGSDVPLRLLYSARTLEDVLYRDELDRLAAHDEVDVRFTLTRAWPEGWRGHRRRIDRELLEEVSWPAAERPLVYVCGPTPFVETAANSFVELGHVPERIRTERFGPTGG
jgi:hypothetical protein